MPSRSCSYSVSMPLALIGLLGITACGPGAQVLEQQRRQIAEKQQLIKETRRRIQAERDRVVPHQQRAYAASRPTTA